MATAVVRTAGKAGELRCATGSGLESAVLWRRRSSAACLEVQLPMAVRFDIACQELVSQDVQHAIPTSAGMRSSVHR
jgi:hypothetical protein